MKRSFKCTTVGTTALAAVVLLVVAPIASAQRLSLAERVERLEQQANPQNDGGSLGLVNQIQALQSQVRTLQGQIEELNHQVEVSKQQARDQYIDLDSRIGRLEGRAPGTAVSPAAAGADNDRQLNDVDLGTSSGAAVPPVAPAPPAGSIPPADAATGQGDLAGDSGLEPSNPDVDAAADADASIDQADEKAAYDQAFAALKDGRYAESARRFQSFIDSYPASDLSGNASYWLGESYYVTQNYRIALQTFENLLQRYPDSEKAPDALLKIGYCQYELKEWDQAEATLTDVTLKYPDTTVARLAESRLRALKTEDRGPTTDSED
ncbi:MAG TPA: tol-pal system protein YbgF [Rhodanobacteraceae bacterium]|nr:tol-pal system protein YbgF [Rhodanobacteraceae bacterium]